MARPLIDDVLDESAPALLQQLRAAGFELTANGDRLRIRPAERITPALRDRLALNKRALLAALAPATEFVYLRGGLTVPLPALELAWELEDRGFRQSVDAAGQYQIEPGDGLRDSDGLGDHDESRIARWRYHLAAIIGYQAPEVM